MKRFVVILLLFSLGSQFGSWAQPDVILESDPQSLTPMEEADHFPEMNGYEEFNPVARGSKLRLCGERPCNGWQHDIYPDGVLKHRGFYAEGALVIYRNYYPSGRLEREFKQQDVIKSMMRTFHPNGVLRSRTRFANGAVIRYEDHYTNGALRYAEERHRSEPYYIRMDLFAPNGEPLSLLRLVDRKRVEFEMKEYYPGGGLRCEGLARYDRYRMDTRKVGTWRHYDLDGSLQREELLVDGKVQSEP